MQYALTVPDNLLEAALAYASKGWSVFPLNPKAKTPATLNGYKAATTDPEQIRRWWTERPDYNVGIATGESALFVLDVDTKPGKDGRASLTQLEAQHGTLPEDTAIVQTGSGGFHVYYQGHTPSSAGRLGRGLDVRSKGGYVVAPPSIHESGQPYTWLRESPSLPPAPEWLTSLAYKPSTKAPSAPQEAPAPRVYPEATPEVLAAAKADLDALGPATEPGTGNQKAFAACAILRNNWGLTFDEALPLVQEWDLKCVNQRAPGELEALLHNGAAYGHNEPYGSARENFLLWQMMLPPEAVADVAANVDPDFAAVLVKAKVDLASRGVGAKHVRTDRFAPESMADLRAASFPEVPWLVQGLLIQKALNTIAGEPKTTKTWCGLELGVAVASGTKAFGEFPVRQSGPVVFFLAEDDRRGTWNRLRALTAYRELTSEQERRIHVFCRQSLNLESADDVAWLVANIRALPEAPVLAVLDPLRDLHTADEDKSTAMSQVGARLRALRDVLDCAVIFVHHASKAPTNGANQRRPGQRMRGSSAIHGIVDGGMYLYDLDTNGEDYWENTAAIELKAARGAGQFALGLTVEDDIHGQALRATWVYKIRRDNAGSAKDDANEAKVLEYLKGRWDAGFKDGFPAETIKKGAALSMKGADWLAFLKHLAEEKHCIEAVMQGVKPAGYRISAARRGEAAAADAPDWMRQHAHTDLRKGKHQ